MHILGNIADHIADVRIGQDVEQLLVHHVRVHLQILAEQGQAASHQCLLADGADLLPLVVHADHLGTVILPLGIHSERLGPIQAFHHHPAVVAAGLAELLPHPADRAHMVNVLFLGHIGGDILLGGKEDEMVGLDRRVQCSHRGVSLHIEGQEHTGENAQPPEREHGQNLYFIFNIV